MLNNLKNKKKKKGFTLIELIIVIAIIAILAAIAIPKFGDVKTKANLNADIANAKTLANAAAVLIADETIKPVAEGKVYVIEGISDNDIEGYLQSVPTPKSTGYSSYKVQVDPSGNVKVYLDKDNNETLSNNKKELYPTIPTKLAE